MKHIKLFDNFSANNLYFYNGQVKNRIHLSNGRFYFMNESVGVYVGYVDIDFYTENGYINNFTYNQYEAHLSSFQIKEEFQNKGYAKYFFKEIVDSLLKLGIHFISLSVEKDNTIALNLYKKFGFIESEHSKSYKGVGKSSNNTLYLIKETDKIK